MRSKADETIVIVETLICPLNITMFAQNTHNYVIQRHFHQKTQCAPGNNYYCLSRSPNCVNSLIIKFPALMG